MRVDVADLLIEYIEVDTQGNNIDTIINDLEIENLENEITLEIWL